MPRRYHRAPEFRREHTYVLLFLPACHSRLRTYIVYLDSRVTREGFHLRVNLQKTRVHGCAHAIRAILNASTMLVSIKFKSSCTVYTITLHLYKDCGVPFAIKMNHWGDH